MILLKNYVRLQFHCDVCGTPQTGEYEHVADARAAAEREGFAISDWKLGGNVPRQTCTCKACFASLESRE